MKLVPIAIALGLLLVPASTAGEFDLQSLNDQVQNHEARIGDLENRADNTETQVAQNTADIQLIQQQTGTSPAPSPSAAPEPAVSEPVVAEQPPATPPPPPPAPTVVRIERWSGEANAGLRTECTYWYSDGSHQTKSYGGDVACE